MDVILKVIEGGKAGAKIAVKKNEFIIGRSQKCHLCAGSTAISRQHCAIIRDENRVALKDLGSRNGTLVNGVKITDEVELASGDEIIVGPLRFMVTITAGINNAKKAEVKTVAEAVVRAAETHHAEVGDDDISKWLLGPVSALTETQTIRVDDTNAMQKLRKAMADDELEPATKAAKGEQADQPETEAAEKEDAEAAEKTAPGKLPKIPQKPPSKDSREAAAEALRAWSRRR
jgi:pSer/pThr/pTyr-binding forkhead associated (FHA) protein